MKHKTIKQYKCPKCICVIKTYDFEDFVFTALHSRTCKVCGAVMEELFEPKAGEETRPENYCMEA